MKQVIIVLTLLVLCRPAFADYQQDQMDDARIDQQVEMQQMKDDIAQMKQKQMESDIRHENDAAWDAMERAETH